MCSECNCTPCHPRCPNAPEERPVKTCSICGEGIYSGEKFFEGCYGPVCTFCLESMSPEEILEQVSESMSIA